MFSCMTNLYCPPNAIGTTYRQTARTKVPGDGSCTPDRVLSPRCPTVDVHAWKYIWSVGLEKKKTFVQRPVLVLQDYQSLVYTLQLSDVTHDKQAHGSFGSLSFSYRSRKDDHESKQNAESEEKTTKAKPDYGWLFDTMGRIPKPINKSMACDHEKITRMVKNTTNVLEDLYDRIGPPWKGKGKPLLRSGIPGHVVFFKEVDYGQLAVPEKIKMGVVSFGGVPRRMYVPCRPRVQMGVGAIGSNAKWNAYDMLIHEEQSAIRQEFDISAFLPQTLFRRDLGNCISLVFGLYMLASYMLHTFSYENLD